MLNEKILDDAVMEGFQDVVFGKEAGFKGPIAEGAAGLAEKVKGFFRSKEPTYRQGIRDQAAAKSREENFIGPKKPADWKEPVVEPPKTEAPKQPGKRQRKYSNEPDFIGPKQPRGKKQPDTPAGNPDVAKGPETPKTDLKDKAGQMFDKVKGAIKDNPIASATIGAGGGYILAKEAGLVSKIKSMFNRSKPVSPEDAKIVEDILKPDTHVGDKNWKHIAGYSALGVGVAGAGATGGYFFGRKKGQEDVINQLNEQQM